MREMARRLLVFALAVNLLSSFAVAHWQWHFHHGHRPSCAGTPTAPPPPGTGAPSTPPPSDPGTPTTPPPGTGTPAPPPPAGTPTTPPPPAGNPTTPPPPGTGTPAPPPPAGTPTTPPPPGTGTPAPPPPAGTPTTPPPPVTGTPAPPPPPGTPTTPPPPGGNNNGTCPINTLRLAVCANVLNLLRLNIGVPPGDDQCCPLLQGLVDLDAAVCLCLAIRANILGIVLNVPVDLSLLLNFCRQDQVPGFTCPTT